MIIIYALVAIFILYVFFNAMSFTPGIIIILIAAGLGLWLFGGLHGAFLGALCSVLFICNVKYR